MDGRMPPNRAAKAHCAYSLHATFLESVTRLEEGRGLGLAEGKVKGGTACGRNSSM